MDWTAVIKKQTKPPIVPSKRANACTPRGQEGAETNPYALLNCNFDAKFYDRDINMYQKKSKLSISKSDLTSEPESI